MEQLFAAHDGPLVHKWLHYLPVYDRHFAGLRGTDVSILEIGVSKGGSLQLWREYFGPEARIFGIDIDPDCRRFDGRHGQVRIGSQADPAFLQGIVAEMGGVDVVIDDGSHMQSHVEASFHTLFPLLNPGGIYLVEDLHTAYWPTFEGGYRRRTSFIETAKDIVDDMHHWYHRRRTRQPVAKDLVTGVHFYDSIVVLDKNPARRPAHVMVGDD